MSRRQTTTSTATRPPKAERAANPYANLDIFSLLIQAQPQLDIGSDALTARCSVFKAGVEKFVVVNREEIVKRREIYTNTIAREREAAKELGREIEGCKQQEIQLIKRMEEEKRERKEADDAHNNHNRQIKAQKAKIAERDEQIQLLEANLAQLKKAKEKERRQLDKQASRLEPEVLTLETLLGFSVEGAGSEMLLVRFMHLDSRDPDRECTLFVDLSQDDYKGEKLRLELEQKIDLDLDLLHHAALWIPTEPGALRVAAVRESSPMLPTLPILVEEMNATRDFYGFLRRVREAFCEQLRSGES